MLKELSPKKHIPMRTCIATGIKKPKNDLIRLVKLSNGQVVIDLLGKERGRGANLDLNTEAFDLAVKKNVISKALKLERNLTETEIEYLRKEFISALELKKFRQGKRSVTIRVDKGTLARKLAE
ncbi:YlxR family protein [Candidatus Dojkabacteria bacterium]|nr:YlxR family protein [Candidatus Dojkabacteria bacterium]